MLKAATLYVRRNAVAFLALFVALGGTATATHLAVDGSDVVDESLTGDDVRGDAPDVDGTIKGEDIQDGTLNSKDVGIGGINAARILDDSLTTDDVKSGSLNVFDLDFGSRTRTFVHSTASGPTYLEVDSGSLAIGESEVIGGLLFRTESASGGESFLRVGCPSTGFTVTYENIEGGPDGGYQRVWIDTGSTLRYRTLAPGALLTALSSNTEGPETRRVTIRAHSVRLDMDGAFDVMVARVQEGRGDPCQWHLMRANTNKG